MSGSISLVESKPLSQTTIRHGLSPLIELLSRPVRRPQEVLQGVAAELVAASSGAIEFRVEPDGNSDDRFLLIASAGRKEEFILECICRGEQGYPVRIVQRHDLDLGIDDLIGGSFWHAFDDQEFCAKIWNSLIKSGARSVLANLRAEATTLELPSG